MELTVIIPVYNTDVCQLDECLKSITQSTLDKTDYEILMIDDGSTVDYTSLISTYNLRCIKTENRGIFAARLLGVREARGEYIAFVDSDDTVSFNYHLPMLMAAKEGGYDVIYNDWAFHTSRTRYTLRCDSTISGNFDTERALDLFFSKSGREHSYYVLWNKIYKRELLLSAINEAELLTKEVKGFNYSEDALINFLAHKKAKKVKNIHTGYYFYRIHGAQTVSVNSKERLASQINNMSLTLRIMQTIVSNSDPESESLSRIAEWRQLMCRTHYSYARANGWVDLYPTLKLAYSVERLETPKLSDGIVYQYTSLLPSNFTEIDEALYRIYKSDSALTIKPTRDRYARISLEYLLSYGVAFEYAKGGTSLPKGKNRLIDKILHFGPLRLIAFILFPKGSKIRAFLKSKL